LTRGYIYNKTRKNTIAMLVWAIVLFILCILYVSDSYIYLLNAHSAGHELDAANLRSNSRVLTIEPESEAFNTRDHMVVMPPFLRINELFVDGASYRFQFTAESFEDAGFGYGVTESKTLEILYANPQTHSYPPNTEFKVGFISIEGVKYVALLPADYSIIPGDTIKGAVFSELPLFVGHDLGMTENAGANIPSYIVDLRGLTVEDEFVDFGLVIFFSILFPTFLIYSILCLFKPNIHPNYIRIAKFGDIDKVCAEIDEEITHESTYKEKKKVYTTHYIIEETLYNTRVRKNHMLRH
jgi:hypothetical protein